MSATPRFARLGAGLALACAALSGCARPVDDAPEPENGHARMIEILAEVEARTADENMILGDAQAREVRARIAALDPNAPPSQSLPLRMNLSDLELRLGNIDAAIELLTRANELLERTHELQPVPAEYRADAAYRLGVAYLRLGETENCCLRHSPESCILPIRGSALHVEREGSERAREQFARVRDIAEPGSQIALKALWLDNVAAMTLGEYPNGVAAEDRLPEHVMSPGFEFPRFENIAGALGLDLFDLAGGIIVDDFDGDEWFDVLVSTWDPSGQIRFFRNRGDGTFEDRTIAAGLEGLNGGFNLNQADFDNDGDLDALVLRGAWLQRGGRIPNSLLRNDGGTFTDVTFESGLGDVHYPTQAASWSDFDLDGDLDLYVGNEPIGQEPAPCQLFRNEGNGTFVDVAEAAGVRNLRYTKAVIWGDANGDGRPDLYVSNLDMKNRLYENRGDGTFADVADSAGVALPLASFPVWFWDFDNDGARDLFVAGYDWRRGNLAAVVASMFDLPGDRVVPALYRGDGAGGFRDVAPGVALTRVTLPMGANFGDLDNDGFLDFYLGTGYPDYEAVMPNVMMRNAAGARFEDVTIPGGFGHLQKGHAVSFADYDNDGDADVFEQIGGFYAGDRFANAVFENPGFGNRWISLRVVGTRSNRSAIGARIRVDVEDGGGTRTVYRDVNSGGSFGANPLRQTIGLGGASRVERVTVRWPATGEEQTFAGLELDRTYRIVEGDASAARIPLGPSATP